MENINGNSYGVEIPKKSRSLDLKSLYKSKVSKEISKKSLKRKGSSEVNGDKKNNPSKKSKKAVSLSSFENVEGNKKKSLVEVCNDGPSSPDLQDTKLVQPKNLSSGSKFNDIAFSLGEGVVKIPKRKRGLVGRSKFESIQVNRNEHISKSSSETKSAAQNLKLKDDSSSKPPLKNGESSLRKSRSNHGKKKKASTHYKKNAKDVEILVPNAKDTETLVANAKDAEPLVATAGKVSKPLLEDDEENLEENAARMLSSRFDPSCTGFSSNSKVSASPSVNELSLLLSSGQNFVTHNSRSLSISESASIDSVGRVLRPRKHSKEKRHSTKRRHFYEIFSRDIDAYWVINRRIKVFWPLDKSWYYGLVSEYDEEKKLHHVKYDDRDEEWINLNNERFKLLLLPSEVPGKTESERSRGKTESERSRGKTESERSRGKTESERSRARDTHSSKKDEEKMNLKKNDDSCAGSFMESEPIISWLARSTNRFKSASFHTMKKQKASDVSPFPLSSPLSDEAVNVNVDEAVNVDESGNVNVDEAGNVAECDEVGCDEGVSSKEVETKIHSNASSDRYVDARNSYPSSSSSSPKESKLPIVYFRRRLKTGNHLTKICEDSYVGPMTSEGDFSVGDEIWDPENFLRSLNVDTSLWWIVDNSGMLKKLTQLNDFREFSVNLKFPILSVSNYSSEAETFWLFRALFLLQHGAVMTFWRRVRLEMLFVDNLVGLRFLYFEGCLKQAVEIVFLILSVFNQSNEKGKYADVQLPVTTIRFKFSCNQDLRKQFVFAFYNFFEMKDSNWIHLDKKLKEHCLLTTQLPLSECTYDNIKALQNGCYQLPCPFACRDTCSIEGLRRRTRQGIDLKGNLKGASRESSCAKVVPASINSNKKQNYPSPFALSFAAAPSFFRSLHLKLLMENNLSHINFTNRGSVENFKTPSCLMMVDNVKTSQHGATCHGCSSCMSCPFDYVSSVGTFGSTHNLEEIVCDSNSQLQKTQCSPLEPIQCYLSPSPPVERDKTAEVSNPLLNGIKVDILELERFEKDDREPRSTQQLTDLTWDMNSGTIRSPNPTAPRSVWHRNKSSSSSFGSLSRGWSNGKPDLLHNNFGNGPKKPRTQVSYLPFGGSECGSRNKSQSQKGYPHKRIRRTTDRRSTDVSRGSLKNLELLSCDVNVLITLGDRGWRECGAHVLLELFDHNEWKLAVKISGTTSYSYKAHQFQQPGSVNRYTHAMMWKGGKDWILEFPDRGQWALFKEMHEECYDRNMRAALVKNIPIPGVRLLEENEDYGTEVAFVRCTSRYFRQIENDVEMALDPSRYLYDMDSDDEQWLRKTQECLKVDGSNSWDISEEIFEKTINIFEKASYVQHCDQFTVDEMEEFMAGVGPIELIIRVHEYWRLKRQGKGMPLLRHLQPPLWERYQQQVREWEHTMTRLNTSLPSGYQENVEPVEKPAMFAFCLKPRGLEVPNKGSKQRSQKKFSISGHINSCLGDYDGLHTSGRRLNGFASVDERVVYPVHNYESLDESPLPHTSSPKAFSLWDTGNIGYFSTSVDGYDKNHQHKLKRSKSKSFGALTSPNEMSSFVQMLPGRKNGISRYDVGCSEWQSFDNSDGSQKHYKSQFDSSEIDEFRLRDASGAARHALKMAKLKSEKAQRMLYRADLAIHKAVVALMTADAIKAASEVCNGNG